MNSNPKYWSLSAIFLTLALNVLAQGQNNNWFTGPGKYINFNSGTPVISVTDQATSLNGACSISDAAGNLLFYTDGLKVFNAAHTQMPNGSGLTNSVTFSPQQTVIIPKPGSASVYYIFTVSGTDLYYSLVDMTLDAGAGDVTSKNIIVASTVTVITATRQRDGVDYWIVGKTRVDPFRAGFKSFRVSASGITAGPVFAENNILDDGEMPNAMLKISNDGCRLVSTENGSFDFPRKDVILYRFNNYSGAVSEGTVVQTVLYPYSIAFSPDNNKFYIGQRYMASFGPGPTTIQPILQFDLNAGSDAQILASAVAVSSPAQIYNLAVAPDLKIYFTRLEDGTAATLAARTEDSHHTLGVISAPNAAGISSSVNMSAVSSPLLNINQKLSEFYNLTYNGALTLCSSVAALQWNSFTGKEEDNNAVLRWSMEEDQEIMSFEIQYATDGNTFKTAGALQAMHDGLSGHSYTFTDLQFSNYRSAAVFYRIKGKTTGGAVLYSSTIRLNRANAVNPVNVYPNPFSSTIDVKPEGNAGDKILNIMLYDASGKLLFSYAGSGKGAMQINGLAQLSPGTYILKTVTEKGTFYKQLLKR